ncbi:MAG: hypothetical protein QXK06_04520 [Candidatus Diapherotrites archaeon]
MEMPIWAIITLFLAISVASLILLFGTDMLASARNALNNWFPQESPQIIRQPSISDTQVAELIEQCYKNSYGKALKQEVCFSITLDNAVNLKSASISPLVKIDQNHFKINDGNTRSFSIVWDFANSKVEVIP